MNKVAILSAATHWSGFSRRHKAEFAVCIKAQASAAETVAADIIESRTPDQSAENIRLTHTRAPLFFMLTFVNENEMP
ncbi:MAG: hypothetical protein WCD20_07330 [Rhodomicrobium sp.]